MANTDVFINITYGGGHEEVIYITAATLDDYDDIVSDIKQLIYDN